ncbi:MAG: LolA-like outer membrane lipoprotein chaperone [Campylobacterota bacterium]|nr:LolA-like outer membrane lipoprotein chaperone [Campylobacterota bacterium]
MKLLISLCFSIFILSANDLADIKTFQASFKQYITNSSSKVITYNGDIYIKQPSLIFWQYNNPIEKNVYITNQNVTIIEPDLEQAIISNLEKEINLLKLLKDAKHISNNIYKSNLYSRDYILTIENNILNSIEYSDELDNKVKISFFNIKQNQNINENIFKFIIPYEYDIIRK